LGGGYINPKLFRNTKSAMLECAAAEVKLPEKDVFEMMDVTELLQ